MAFVLMKIFEEAPRRFDRWMHILTLGRLQRIREHITNELIGPDQRVLEIGCGTGSLLQAMAERGAQVEGIDTAEGMIETATEKLGALNLSGRAQARQLHALQIEDEFEESSFDRVVSILAFSEMLDDEIDCLLRQCHSRLKPGGELILVDEVEPRSFFKRQIYRAYRHTARLVTFLGLQAADLKKANFFMKFLYFLIEFPLMLLAFLVVPPITHPLSRLNERLEASGFRIRKTMDFLGGSLQLLQAAADGQPDELPDPRSIAEHYQPRKGLLYGLRIFPRRVFQLVFRSVAFPVLPRMIILGNPNRSSPVLITTNFDGTVRYVTKALEGLDAYLLVAPAGGLDVWCAAGGNRFNIDSIVSILKTSRVAELVKHRRLVLPQLCANGINMFDVRRKTKWSAVFGPVDAADIPEYLSLRQRPDRMMRVTFHPQERLEMATAMWGSLSLRYTIFPVLVFGLGVAGWFVGGIAAMAALISLGCFVIPGKTFVQKAGLAFFLPGLAAILGTDLWLHGTLSLLSLKWGSLLLLASYLVGSSYPSYTPLWQCGYSTLFYGFPNLELDIIEEDCIGCNLCDQVCPVECFSTTENNKMIFSRPDLCEGCMACLVQCPTDAIINEVADEHQRLSQCQ